jgi:hypothetical protein
MLKGWTISLFKYLMWLNVCKRRVQNLQVQNKIKFYIQVVEIGLNIYSFMQLWRKREVTYWILEGCR